MGSSNDLDSARYILEQWARWLLCGGGYAERSSIAQFSDGFGINSGVIGARLPLHVEPGLMVRCASRAMQHLRTLDGPAAELLTRVYLEQELLLTLAERDEVSLSQLKDRRRAAERAFYALYCEMKPRSDQDLKH